MFWLRIGRYEATPSIGPNIYADIDWQGCRGIEVHPHFSLRALKPLKEMGRDASLMFFGKDGGTESLNPSLHSKSIPRLLTCCPDDLLLISLPAQSFASVLTRFVDLRSASSEGLTALVRSNPLLFQGVMVVLDHLG